MSFSLLTALEIANNYPEGILINSAQQKCGKYASFCYKLNGNGEIHKIMLNTSANFYCGKDAENYMHKLAKWCKIKYNKNCFYKGLILEKKHYGYL